MEIQKETRLGLLILGENDWMNDSHLNIFGAKEAFWRSGDRYCVILVMSYYRPFGRGGLAPKPSGFTVGDKVREACYCNSPASIYVSLNSFIIYSPDRRRMEGYEEHQ